MSQSWAAHNHHMHIVSSKVEYGMQHMGMHCESTHAHTHVHTYTLCRIHTISHVPRGMSPEVWASSSGRGHVLLSASSTNHTCTQRRGSDTPVSVSPRHGTMRRRMSGMATGGGGPHLSCSGPHSAGHPRLVTQHNCPPPPTHTFLSFTILVQYLSHFIHY